MCCLPKTWQPSNLDRTQSLSGTSANLCAWRATGFQSWAWMTAVGWYNTLQQKSTSVELKRIPLSTQYFCYSASANHQPRCHLVYTGSSLCILHFVLALQNAKLKSLLGTILAFLCFILPLYIIVIFHIIIFLLKKAALSQPDRQICNFFLYKPGGQCNTME